MPFDDLALPLVTVSLLLAGCGPLVEPPGNTDPNADASTTIVDASTTVVDEGTTTLSDDEDDWYGTTLPDELTTIDPMPPDMGPPGPSLCPAGAGDLSLEWSVTEASESRADAVAVGPGLVAWATGEFFDGDLRVLDRDGNPQWSQPVPLFGGEGELSLEDLEIDPDGRVILAGTIDNGAFDGLFRWYDSSGNVLAEDVLSTPGFETWQGVARLPDGDVVVAGERDEDMFLRRYTPEAGEVWSRSFGEQGAAWASHVAVAPDGTILVSGHSNMIPGPVLLAYDGAGTLLWSYLSDGGVLDVAASVAADGQGRAWLTVISDADEHRVERFDVGGTMDLTIPLDFRPNAIATDVDDSIVVAGAILGSSTIVVERYTSESTHLARYERPGRFATGVVVDEECHAYVVGFTNGDGAWLEKLR